MASVFTPLTSAARDPINQWQVGPWRRGARRHRVLFKLLRLATRRRAVLRATFLDSSDSFGHFNPERRSRVERACACERVNVHMCEARALGQ